MGDAKHTREPSATVALLAAGYGHRPGRFKGKHEVFSLATGEVMGAFDAAQAWQFLAALEAIPRAALSKAGV